MLAARKLRAKSVSCLYLGLQPTLPPPTPSKCFGPWPYMWAGHPSNHLWSNHVTPSVMPPPSPAPSPFSLSHPARPGSNATCAYGQHSTSLLPWHLWHQDLAQTLTAIYLGELCPGSRSSCMVSTSFIVTSPQSSEQVPDSRVVLCSSEDPVLCN